MKIPLILSFALNAALLVFVIYSVKSKAKLPESRPNISTAPVSTEPAGSITPQPSPAVFSWSQVESKDYPSYISNLRKIGCPERTIRYIITAEVDNLHDDKLKENHDPEAQQKSQREETILIGTLLGPVPKVDPTAPSATASVGLAQSDAAPAPDSTISVNSPGEVPPQEAGVSIPLAFVPPAPDLSMNSPQQKEALAQLQQGFKEAVSGTQGPSTPAYRARWQNAQPSSDAMFKLWFGSQAYMAQQYQAYMKNNP